MSRLIAFAVIILVLVILAVQNMAPPISLVMLGSTTLTLPLAIWLVGAIAIGAILALVIYGLASTQGPSHRPYRPLGQRIRVDDYARDRGNINPEKPNSQRPSSQFTHDPKRASSSPTNAYDTDWESFKAPQQWDNWGERPSPETVAAQKASQSSQSKGFFGFKRPPPYSPDTSVNDIESGWDDYRSNQPIRDGSFVSDNLDEISEGWDDEYGADNPTPQDSSRNHPTPRIYRDGSLYSSDRPNPLPDPEDSVPSDIFNDDNDNLGPAQVGPDGVYEADYRVIIPPYKPMDEQAETDNP